MKRQPIFYLILAMCVLGLLACGGDSDDDEDVADQPTKQPATQTPAPVDGVKQEEIDFAKEDADIRDLFTRHADVIITKKPDKVMVYWLKSESQDVFAAWNWWAGQLQQHIGWRGVKNGWMDIFRVRGGDMTVDILSLAIDKGAQNATLRASYEWAGGGDLIAAIQRDKKDEWKIRAIDYTNERFGELIEELKDPAYKKP